MRVSFVILSLLFFSAVSNAQHENHQTPAANAAQSKSPRKTAMALVGKNHVHIDYGSPSVRGRNIWNGLVAYDQVWATGAHKATWVEFSSDVQIAGKKTGLSMKKKSNMNVDRVLAKKIKAAKPQLSDPAATHRTTAGGGVSIPGNGSVLLFNQPWMASLGPEIAQDAQEEEGRFEFWIGWTRRVEN